jgi:hypothetical protein
MSRKRTSGVSLTVAAGSFWALFLVLAGTSGCDTYSTLKDAPIDCTVDDGYEFLTLGNNFDNVGDGVFWSSGDNTPDKVVGDDASGNVSVRTIPDGPRCDSSAAVVLRAAGNNDWGCLFGSNNVGAPRDASAYEGLSFWARAPGNTTKGFIVLLDDPNTTVIDPLPHNCTNLGSTTGGPQTIIVSVDGQNVQTSSGATRPTYPEECGNSYAAPMLVTGEWAFYTVPFAQFQQTALPNRVPNAVLTQVGTAPGTALLTDKIYTLIIRFPKEATVELWLDNLAFYRKKTM